MQGNRNQLMFGELMMQIYCLCRNKLIAGYSEKNPQTPKHHLKNLFGKCYQKKKKKIGGLIHTLKCRGLN